MRLPASIATRLTIGAVAAGIVLRLVFLGADSFWLDEANSVVIASGDSISGLWAHADPRHPPLYYLILKAALHVAGRTEWAARLPSALASIFSLYLVFLLARRLRLSVEASLLAVSLMAVSSIDIWYAREARMYALAATAGLLAAVGLTIDARPGFLVAAAGAALAVHLDYTMIPVVAFLVGLWWARWWQIDRRPPSVVRLTAALVLAGLAVHPLWDQLRDIAALADGATFFTNVKRVTGGFRLSPAIVVVGLVGEVLAMAVVGYAVWLVLHKRRGVGSICTAALFTIANAALILPRAYSAKQILVTIWPYLTLLTAWLVAGSRAKVPAVVVLVSLLASAASLTVHRADWRGVVAHLNRTASADPLVILDPPWNTIPYEFYGPLHAGATAVSPEAGGDVWLVAERYGQPPPTSPMEAWLDSHARLMEVVPFARLELRRYRIR